MMKRAVLAVFLAAFSVSIAHAAGPRILPLHKAPQPTPAIAFTDEIGEPLSLDNYRGKVVLLNVWATWCGPCRREMPALDRLRGRLGSDRFDVVTLSIDRAGPGSVRRFYGEIGIGDLPITIDRSAQVARDLKVRGIPTTILLGADGEELGRLVGPSEWDAEAMVDFLETVIGQQAEAGGTPGTATTSPGAAAAN